MRIYALDLGELHDLWGDVGEGLAFCCDRMTDREFDMFVAWMRRDVLVGNRMFNRVKYHDSHCNGSRSEVIVLFQTDQDAEMFAADYQAYFSVELDDPLIPYDY